MSNYWNYERDDKIICPYCMAEWESSAEDTYIGGERVHCYEEKIQTVTCDECGKRFTITPILTWTYETETVDGEATKDEIEEMRSAL